MNNLTEKFTSDKAKYIIENPSGDLQIIEETIIQFFSLRPHKATEFLLAALQDPAFKKETLIKLITHIPLQKIKIENRVIGTCDPDPAYEDEGGPVYINHATVLLDALLRNDYEITKSIVLYQKTVLNDALIGLLELDSMRKLDYVKHNHYYSTVDSSLTLVKDITVLSALDTAVNVFVNLDYEPKLPPSSMDYMQIGHAPKVPLLCEAKRLNRIVKLDDMLQFIKRNESKTDGFRSILYSFNEFPHKLGTLIQQFLKDSKFPFELSDSKLSHINGFEYRQLAPAFLKALTLIPETPDINFLSTLLMYRNLIGLKLQPLSNPVDGTVVAERLNELQPLFDLCSSTVVCKAILIFQKDTIEIHREALILSDITAAIHGKYPTGTTLPLPNGVKKILEILANPDDSTEDKYDKTKATIDGCLRFASIKNAVSFGYFSEGKSFYTLLASTFSNYSLLASTFSEIPSNLIESGENKKGIN